VRVFVLALATLAGCAHWDERSIGEMFPVGTSHAEVDQRLARAHFCVERETRSRVFARPCAPGTRYRRAALFFQTDQATLEMVVGSVVSKDELTELRKRLDARYGKGELRAGVWHWETDDESVALSGNIENHTVSHRGELQRLSAQGSTAAKASLLQITLREALERDDGVGATRQAYTLLELAMYHPNERYTGDAIHQGHVALGLVALAKGDVATAKWELLAAGRTSSSAVLVSFGPNMMLALALLHVGERDVVREYLTLCRGFWTMGVRKLDRWDAEIAAGKTPDFGANLFY
jgi:hypothetical protein